MASIAVKPEEVTVNKSTDNFRAARDQLLRCTGDYDAALRDFHWPDLGD